MNRRLLRALAAVLAGTAALAALGGCGERSQTMDRSPSTSIPTRSNSQPWSVSDAATPAYTAPGWKAGDKAAWEEQLRQRNQAQNDYLR